ncbi:MAG: HAD-IB family hydrolase [Gammaproteobacteria bacterium]
MNIRYAFFDVDETLVNFKSMFKFYKYWLCKKSRFGVFGGYFSYFLFSFKIKFLSYFFKRSEINKKYYAQYAGFSEKKLKLIGEMWWKDLLKKEPFFHAEVLDQFFFHKKNGVKTVLVSGSMGLCLEPLKIYLGADYAIWTDLEVKDGRLTGELLGEPNIGQGKVRRILSFLEKQPVKPDLLNSYAYGDHESDIPMLDLVGNPYFVIDGFPHNYKSISIN